jgi:hypothetical protein
VPRNPSTSLRRLIEKETPNMPTSPPDSNRRSFGDSLKNGTSQSVNPVRRSSTFKWESSYGALNPVFDVKKILSSSLLQAVGLSNGVKNPSYPLRLQRQKRR